MAGNRRRSRESDLLFQLMAAKGWSAEEVQRRSLPAGNPEREVSARTVYRVLNNNHVPSLPVQFEIAQTFGLTPNHIWGRAPLPPEVEALGVVA
jgi:hypothetical protein